jgi:hypothetical protein
MLYTDAKKKQKNTTVERLDFSNSGGLRADPREFGVFVGRADGDGIFDAIVRVEFAPGAVDGAGSTTFHGKNTLGYVREWGVGE